MLDESAVRATVDAYVNAWEKADREALLALYTEDAEFEDPAGASPLRGRQAIAAFWDRTHAGGATFRPEPERVVVCGNEALLVFRMSVRGPGGGGLDLDVVDHFVFAEDGRIRRARAFWDDGCRHPVAPR